jgi:uncharacterized protein YgiM (DUF1202 family)
VATTTQKWVGGGAVVLAIVLLYSAHDSQTTNGGGGTGTGTSGPCTVTVTADVLNVRSSPDNNALVVQTYSKGEVVSADRTVQNGFRQLGPGRWAAREYLAPRPGSDCG